MDKSVDNLVYLKRKTKSNYTEGAIFKAEVIQKRIHTIILRLLTDSNGEEIDDPFVIITGHLSIYQAAAMSSNISKPYTFYHFPKNNLTEKNNYVKNMVKVNKLPSLALTGFAQYGSGIYGQYIPSNLITTMSQEMRQITLQHPFIIKDQATADLITLASLNLNLWSDNTLLQLKSEDIPEQDIYNVILWIIPEENIFLWNIILANNNLTLTRERMAIILAKYYYHYIYGPRFEESETKEKLEICPINALFLDLGYDGLFTTTEYGNKWSRGCVSYQFSSQDDFLQSNQENHF